MEVSMLQTLEVSELCIGKPAVRAIPLSSTVGDALGALQRTDSGQNHLAVWDVAERKACAGKVCMVDVLCYLCSEENIAAPAAALGAPISAILPPRPAAPLVRRVEPNSSILEALDVILDGAHSLVVAARPAASRRKCGGGADASASEFCWLTQEDFVRFFLNSIAAFSPTLAFSITDLALIRAVVLTVRPRDPALSALPFIRAALADKTSVAVVDDDGRLVGEISPSTLAKCGERIAPALAALSVGDLMAYVDYFGAPPESTKSSIKARLREKKLLGMLELLEADFTLPFSSSSSTSSSSSSSSDEDSSLAPTGALRRPRAQRSLGSYSARMGRQSEEAIVCHPGSSMVAVTIQALAHRVSYVWVVDDDYFLAGVVRFSDILGVFQDMLQ